jgi:hypothetical protein
MIIETYKEFRERILTELMYYEAMLELAWRCGQQRELIEYGKNKREA